MTRASELYFEELGDRFEAYMSSYDVDRRLALIARLWPGMAKEGRALEVGCGTGRISAWLVPRVDELVVSDLSETLCRQAGERLGCAWSVQDACAMTLPNASFDWVVSSECIEHVPRPMEAIREMVRVLKPGGWLVLTTPNRLWYPLLATAQTLRLRRFQGNELWLWPGDLASAVRRAGARVRRRGGCHLLPWQIPTARRWLPWFEGFDRQLHRVMINVGVAAEKPRAGGSGS